MKLKNIKLIMFREMRDQLRDRRTLFMIAVMPLLLYPLLGALMMQMSQFLTQQPARVLIVGASEIQGVPELFEGPDAKPKLLDVLQKISASQEPADLTAMNEAIAKAPAEQQPSGAESVAPSQEAPAESYDAEEGSEGKQDTSKKNDDSGTMLLKLELMPVPENASSRDPTDVDLEQQDRASELVSAGDYNVALYFPPNFAQRLHDYLVALKSDNEQYGDLPSPEIIFTTTSDASAAARFRVERVLDQWKANVVEDQLAARGVPMAVTQPFDYDVQDVAEETGFVGASMWAKMLPVLLLLWALTGAFYPAVDLCAGEKERGTLETLLSSPAARGEIVVGKLLSVMIFSMATAALNLASLGLTGLAVVGSFPDMAPPPVLSPLWLLIALVPMSALFSALCVALAVMARSTKEGQYYLVPLMMVAMPLAMIPMSPSVELNLGTALIPVTNVVLVLKALIVGSYWSAAIYLPIVATITLVACYLSVSWAIDQFNRESVLFRESERMDLGLYVRHLFRDKHATPTFAMALIGGILILAVRFFMDFTAAKFVTGPPGWSTFVTLAIVVQFGAILIPTLLLTFSLTKSPRTTLGLKLPPLGSFFWVGVLAIGLNPLYRFVGEGIMRLYPVSEATEAFMRQTQQQILSAPLWQGLLVLALLPAICEELAFRGFMLSGLRQMGRRSWAIVISAIFFGMTHGILQQSLAATVLGVLLGFVVIKTGSILPGMVFHFIHNGLGVGLSHLSELHKTQGPGSLFHWLYADPAGETIRTPLVVFGALIAALAFLRFLMYTSPTFAAERQHDRYDHPPAADDRDLLRDITTVGVSHDEATIKSVRAVTRDPDVDAIGVDT